MATEPLGCPPFPSPPLTPAAANLITVPREGRMEPSGICFCGGHNFWRFIQAVHLSMGCPWRCGYCVWQGRGEEEPPNRPDGPKAGAVFS